MNANPEPQDRKEGDRAAPPLSLADYVAASAAWLRAAVPPPAGSPPSSPKARSSAWVGASPPPGWEEALPRLLRSAEYWQKILGPNPAPPPAAEPGRETEPPATETGLSAGTNPGRNKATDENPAGAAAPGPDQKILYPRRYRFSAAGPQLHLTPTAAWAAWAAMTADPAADPGPLLVTADEGRTWRPAAAAPSQAARRDPAILFQRDE